MSDLPAIITALSVLITAVGGFWAVLHQVGKVHKMVNSNNDALLAEQRRLNDRVEQLRESLMAAGIRIPDRPDNGGTHGT